MDLDPHHILKSTVCHLREGHYAICGNGSVANIFHTAEIGILHADLSINSTCVHVSGIYRLHCLFKIVSYLCDLFTGTIPVFKLVPFPGHSHDIFAFFKL